jgi:hypothetical protein
LQAFQSASLDQDESDVLDKLRATPAFQALAKQKHDEFVAGLAIGQRSAL